jgi:hypothetical protein
MRSWTIGLLLVVGVGCGEGSEKPAGSGGSAGSGGVAGTSGTAGAGATLGSGGTAGAPPMTTRSFFDRCGGKIVDARTGAIDPAEYARQARAWDLATIDCRLGPKFTDAYPGKDDARPTLPAPPEKQVPVSSSAHVDTYQLGAYSMNADAYGVAIAQVLYAPDDDQTPGVDRIYVLDWRNNMITESPERQPGGGGHPEETMTSPEWAAALGHPVRHPITAARSPLGQSANTLILFQDGLIGAAPWSRKYFKFPGAIVPTSLALTSSNEFVLVTVWDTSDPAAPKGRLAVLTAGWGLPTVGIGYTFRYDLGDAPLTLLGYIDLPFATPTFVTAAGNNGYGASIDIYFSPSIAELANPDVRAKNAQSGNDPYTWSPIGSSGYAIVLSRWENKAAFIDLQPLYQYVQTWLLGTQANYDAATGGSVDAPIQDRWPRTFDVAPEQKPVVAFTLDVDHPLTALAGRGPKLVDQDSDSIKAHIASLDGTLRTYDVRALVNRHDQPPSTIAELYSSKVAYDPIAMIFAGDVDPRDRTSTTFGNTRPAYGDSFLVLSRTDRQIEWVHATETGTQVFRRLRDSRLDDPVALDKINAFHDAYVISISDFSLKKVVTYRVGPMSGELVRPRQEIVAPSGEDSIECGGELDMAGHVFQVSSANVP